ncbi:Pvc16 family protein [Aquimarina longa]|uniref:Pvc16 family protein n=1 Tax=Aquimarina longa TaxID=1080221 RepID=UPI000784DEBB|nr:Pvc16 family protein [Aquimarina longa]
MLHIILNIIVDDLNEHLTNKYQLGGQNIVMLANAAKKDFNEEGSSSEGQVVAHFLNLEQEHTSSNELIQKESFDNKIHEVYESQYKVYLLFVFHSQQYSQSLMFLSEVVNYYQGKRYLERSKDGTNVTITDTTIASNPDFKVEMIYHNINLEDSNNMWSNIGNKQQPFAIYKLQVIGFSPAADHAYISDRIESIDSQNHVNTIIN